MFTRFAQLWPPVLVARAAQRRASCDRLCEFALRGTESVLVIDDDGDLGEQMARGLEPLGYAVIGTGDPGDALVAVRADPALWDVVVIDLVVPSMKGLDL